jgi:hypothetical protein
MRYAPATTGSPTLGPRPRDANRERFGTLLHTVGGVLRVTVGNVVDRYHDLSVRQPDGSTHSLAALGR